MMTCRLLCALLVLALCCCPSVCVRATGGEKDVKSSDSPAPKASDVPPAPKVERDGDADLALEIPEQHTGISANTSRSTPSGNHAHQSEGLSGLQAGTNPKDDPPISTDRTAVTSSGAPIPPGTPSPTKDNRESPVLATESAQTQVVIGNSGTENKKVQENTQGVEENKAQTSSQAFKTPNTSYTTTTKPPPPVELSPARTVPEGETSPTASTGTQKATEKKTTTSPSNAKTAPEAPGKPLGNGEPNQNRQGTNTPVSVKDATTTRPAEKTASSVPESGSDGTQKKEDIIDDGDQRPNGKEPQDGLEDGNTNDTPTSTEAAQKTATVNNYQTNNTSKSRESDGSTAVSHTTSPLLLLLVVACAAAAAVVAA
ncbi:Mucin-associated surface protein (MASP) [Trypanosoma cruzi]|uniref:Mucin TcMUCII, putative n=2 Tax=Trypanosoma cruzi TaxID=5693 RepID=Q4DL95_TRYCC|nr:mucin TcMUCII, putative [Trypanosoma cruzi]EAN93303.1 mucin TcMUCII, putative [Trypanosoma cruzi]PWV04148.1 Mucin-associated surface protein (MASP) [Trypanosoma cruzi]|eukprot:XP_815154.1 mucin TcMUCII [Trypanosoma cruzi strain CL Brener]